MVVFSIVATHLKSLLRMNDEQKKIASEIIFFIKDNGNKVFKSKLLNSFDIDPIERTFVLRTLKEEYDLIKVNGELFSLSKKGFEFTSFEDLELKEKLEFEKLKTDLSLAKQTLKEFPKTKYFARIGAFIGIVLVLKELIEWLMTLL